MTMYLWITSALLASPADDFRRDALQCWKDYWLAHPPIVGRVTQTKSSDGRTIGTIRYEIKSNATSAAIRATASVSRSGEESVYVTNSAYSFHLRREGARWPWILSRLVFGKPPNYGFTSDDALGALRRIAICPALTFTSPAEFLPGLVSHDSFRLRQAEQVAEDGVSLIRVDFVLQPHVAQTDPKPSEGGFQFRGQVLLKKASMWLDPSAYWLMRRFKGEIAWQGKDRGTTSGVIEYRMSANGFPLLKRKVSTLNVKLDDGTVRQDRTITEFDLSEEHADDADFLLSAYGFAEPELPDEGVPWFLYLAGGAVLCAVLFIVSVWYGKR